MLIPPEVGKIARFCLGEILSEEPKTTEAKAAIRKRINARRIRTTAVAIASVLGIPVVLLQFLNLSCDTLGLFCVAKSGVEQSAPPSPTPEETPVVRTLTPAPAPAPVAAESSSTAAPSNTTAVVSPVTAKPVVIPDKAWLGVRVEPVTESIARALFMPAAHGAHVTYVATDGPGDRAGLKSGDVISTFDGRIVQTADDLRRMLDTADPKVNATIEVIRKGLHSFITVEFSSSAPTADSGLF